MPADAPQIALLPTPVTAVRVRLRAPGCRGGHTAEFHRLQLALLGISA